MAGPGATRSLDSMPAEPRAGTALPPGELIDGVYRIERLLGEGGSGAVYLVRHEGLGGARFALKVLHETSGRSPQMLAREGRLAAKVISAHVVKVAALGHLPSGEPYLVMEYVEGQTLEQVLTDRDLVTSAAIDCGHQLCLALEAAHEQGLVHGDVSLRNVFLTSKPDGSLHVQLGDFGLARRVRSGQLQTMSMELGNGRGTPRFMAPEVISGDAQDERSDLFSVGVVLYRLLTGAYPFDGETAREIFTATLRGTPVPLAERRGSLYALEPLVMRCLRAEPEARFQSARELREALAAPHQPAPERRPASALAKRRLLVGVAVSACLLGAGAGWRAFYEHARIPLGETLECPDAAVAPGDKDADLAHAIAQATCARVGAALDLDWGGGPQASVIHTRLGHAPGSAYELEAEVAGRRESVRASTPLLAAAEAARRLVARSQRPPLSAAEIRLWGAADAQTAAAVRAVWRRRTEVIIEDYEEEPRSVLRRDPDLPLMHLLLAETQRDPVRRGEARRSALRHADRLPPDRALALRGFLTVDENPEAPDEGLELLRRAYSAAASDPDIGVLYAGALVAARRSETALAVIEELHARFPRRALLAVHYGTNLPERSLEDSARLVAWIDATLPEARGWTDNIFFLSNGGRLAEAEDADRFARRIGVPDERLLIPEALLALAVGDPARIERTSVRLQGSTLSWPQQVGAHMRLAALLLLGQVAAAQSFLQAQLLAHRTAGDEAAAVQDATELLRLSRLTSGPPLGSTDLAWLAEHLARVQLPLSLLTSARVELALARDGTPPAAGAALRELDADIARHVGADALALAAARLRTLPLARRGQGDVAAAQRWYAASATWLADRVRSAFDAALALEAIGDAVEAEGAYRLALSPYAIDRHPFESIAARIRLANLLRKQGRSAEAAALLSEVDRTWASADRGLRELVRAPP